MRAATSDATRHLDVGRRLGSARLLSTTRPKRYLRSAFAAEHCYVGLTRTMLVVRSASEADCRAIAKLLSVLGYSSSEDDVRRRLPRLLCDTACIAVAELDQVVAGLATAHLFDAIHLDSRAAWLTSLVVLPDMQRLGVGRALVDQVESWTRACGCSHISVLTSVQRLDAHAFYEAIGYARTGHRYTKHLTPLT
jgi:N-acetylglutamate synthase-like GNAT family acetyltransferase